MRIETHATAIPTQKVVVVNGNTHIMEMLEAALDTGGYDVVFVSSDETAYNEIKQRRPDLVILCTRIEKLRGFEVLTMLRLDEETRNIPVLTYVTEYEDQDFETTVFQSVRPTLRMN